MYSISFIIIIIVLPSLGVFEKSHLLWSCPTICLNCMHRVTPTNPDTDWINTRKDGRVLNYVSCTHKHTCMQRIGPLAPHLLSRQLNLCICVEIGTLKWPVNCVNTRGPWPPPASYRRTKRGLCP